MSETKIDVDGLLESLDAIYFDLASDDDGVCSTDCAECIRQLQAERGRLLLTISEAGRELNEVGVELEKAAVELAAERQRADSADAALAESDAVWRHNMAEARKTWEADYDQRIARLTARAEGWQADAERLQERAEKAEADVLRERQAAYHARQQRDAARKAFDTKREECDELRSCAHGAIAADYDAACELLYGSGYNQLAARVAELVAERDRLREQLADAEHRVEAVVQGEFVWVAKSEWERLRAERPTMEALKAAATRFGNELYYGTDWSIAFAKHLSPLAADGNAPAIPADFRCPRKDTKHPEWPDDVEETGECEFCEGTPYCRGEDAPLAASAEYTYRAKYDPLTGQPKCERCGNSLARLCPQCDADETFDFTMPPCDECGKPSTHPVKGDGCNWWLCDECDPPAAAVCECGYQIDPKTQACSKCYAPKANPPAIPESSDRPKYGSVPEMLRGIADDIEAKPESVDATRWPSGSLWMIVTGIDRRAGDRLLCDYDQREVCLRRVTVPDDLSAACVADEDIRRGEVTNGK